MMYHLARHVIIDGILGSLAFAGSEPPETTSRRFPSGFPHSSFFIDSANPSYISYGSYRNALSFAMKTIVNLSIIKRLPEGYIPHALQ